MNSEDAANMILEKIHVAFASGSVFGAAGERVLRLSYAIGYESLEMALDRLAKEFGTKLVAPQGAQHQLVKIGGKF